MNLGVKRAQTRLLQKYASKDNNEHRHKHHIKSLRDGSPENDNNYNEEYSRKIINRDRDKILVK